jgi:hypothetical protein
MTANESVWDQFEQISNETDNFNQSDFIGCSANLDILERQLNSSVNDYHSLFSRMLDNALNADKVIDLFINNSARILKNTT